MEPKKRNQGKEKLFTAFLIFALLFSGFVTATIVGPDGIYQTDYVNGTLGNFESLYLDGVNYTANIIAGGTGWDGTGGLFQNGTRELTANWDAGSYNITADNFTAQDFYAEEIGNLTQWVLDTVDALDVGGAAASGGLHGFTHVLWYNSTLVNYQLDTIWGTSTTGALVTLLDSIPQYSATWINLNGTHTLGGTWDTKSFQIYWGNGAGTTVLQRNSEDIMISNNEAGGGNVNQEKLVMKDFTLDGGGSTYEQDVVFSSQLKDSYFENIHLKEFKQDGFTFEGKSGWNTFWVHLANIQYENNFAIQNNGTVVQFNRYAIDSYVTNLWGGNGNGGVAGDYQDSNVLEIIDATDIVVDRIWGVRHRHLIYIEATAWVGGCFFNDIWSDTGIQDSIYIDANNADIGGMSFENIFVIDPFQANYDVFYIDIDAGNYLSDLYVNNLHGGSGGWNVDYHFQVVGSGTLRRANIENNYLVDGASGRYSGVNPGQISNDRREPTNYIMITPYDGSEAVDSGWRINAGGDYVRATVTMPPDVLQVIGVYVWGTAEVAEADEMHLHIQMYGAGDNEAKLTTEAIEVINKDSESTNFADDDVIYWYFDATDDTDIDDLTAGDSCQIKLWHEAGAAPDSETLVVIRNIIIEYIKG